MKYVLGLVFALGSLATLAAPQPQDETKPAPSRPPDLREVLQQYHPGSAAPPRQLTPEERAELRRQLLQFGQPRSASLAVPTKRKEP